MALLNTPEFLILDEPVNGLEPCRNCGNQEFIKNVKQGIRMTILVSSHILEELYQTAIRVYSA